MADPPATPGVWLEQGGVLETSDGRKRFEVVVSRLALSGINLGFLDEALEIIVGLGQEVGKHLGELGDLNSGRLVGVYVLEGELWTRHRACGTAEDWSVIEAQGTW